MVKIFVVMYVLFIFVVLLMVMGMGFWQELFNLCDLIKIFIILEYVGWCLLCEFEDFCYIGLIMLCFLVCLFYGVKIDLVEEFVFEEEIDGVDSSKYVWVNLVYVMVVNINCFFKFYGWCLWICGVEFGGEVQGLLVYIFFIDDGGVDMKCLIEIVIFDCCEVELVKNGFMLLLYKKNIDFVVFIGVQLLQKFVEYDDLDVIVNVNLVVCLFYLFVICCFVYYLKCIVCDKIGFFKEKDEMQCWLQDWIFNYVDGDLVYFIEIIKVQYLLVVVEVVVEEVEGNLGYYNLKFFFCLYYQFEGLMVLLCLVFKLFLVKEV